MSIGVEYRAPVSGGGGSMVTPYLAVMTASFPTSGMPSGRILAEAEAAEQAAGAMQREPRVDQRVYESARQSGSRGSAAICQ
jgi:hypothetical protein